MREPHLSADIAAVADMMRHCALQGRDMTPDGCSFVAGALDQLAFEARTLEVDYEREEKWRQAADARIQALTTPDHLHAVQINMAIVEGRIAGKVVDLRTVFERERAASPREPGDAA
jgi:hypothetical protein